MTQRQQSIGIFCCVAAVAVLGGVVTFVLNPGTDPASQRVAYAAAPPIPTVGSDQDAPAATKPTMRSRAARLLDGIRPSRVLERLRPGKKPEPKGQIVRPGTDGTLSMRRGGAMPSDSGQGKTGTSNYKEIKDFPVSFVFRNFEFISNTDELTSDGLDHVLELSVAAAQTPWPILIESEGGESLKLDGKRQQMIAGILAEKGVGNAVNRVVVAGAGPAQSEGSQLQGGGFSPVTVINPEAASSVEGKAPRAVVPAVATTADGTATPTGDQVILQPVYEETTPAGSSRYIGSLIKQSPEDAHAKSWGCVHCHKDSHDPHYGADETAAFHLGCTDCHGGNPNTKMKEIGHLSPRFPDAWSGSAANPIRAYTLLNHEYPEFIRFVNPGDLRVASLSCGTSGCHEPETLHVKKSMMTHGCMLWGAALYNNGAVPDKWSRYGESYSMYGAPQRIQTVPAPSQELTNLKGILPFLEPLPRFQTSHPSNVLRIFERGGRFIIELGIPERGEEPGRPRQRLSTRGLGTLNRTDPVFVGLAKTRLLDPTLNFLGTNDHPGDYRSSGCTSCHMIYANDRSAVHSGPYGRYGNRGMAAAQVDPECDKDGNPIYRYVTAIDPTIPKGESGHPIAHRFTSAIPTSQCIVCHMHPGTTVMNSFLGYMWSDQETDGDKLYPKIEAKPSSEEFTRAQMANPNDIDSKSLLANYDFLDEVIRLNPELQHTLADFHGHGWSYRAVFKKDRQGNYVNKFGRKMYDVSPADKIMGVKVPEVHKELYRNRTWVEDGEALEKIKAKESALRQMQGAVPVHMLDIHLEKGMHCVDCHFIQDNHGDGNIYGEVRAAIEITCTDCHGTITEYAPLLTSGPAAKGNKWAGMVTQRTDPDRRAVGRNLANMRTPFGKRRFEYLPDGAIVQNSMVEPNISWRVTQVRDTITPNHPDYNAASALSKTVRLDGNGQFEWGDIPMSVDSDGEHRENCAHSIKSMNCISCHSSWNPSCFGCHLPQKADKKMPELHYEGDALKNYTAYCFQTLRDEVFMLAKDGNVTGNRINPVRSACAIHVGSYNGNRESIYYQQQTISAEGLSGIAFSTNVPHTVRGKGETKMCSDCHLSDKDDNNAIMAQLLMQGTNYLNFVGRYVWIGAGDHGVWSPVVQERDEPQSIIGSTMHADAYPQRYTEHIANDKQLQTAYEHPGKDIADNILHPWMKVEIKALQHRGEYLYAACGEAGFRVYDIAFTDNKAFAERYTTAPVSPLGQRFYVRTDGICTDVKSPTTIAPDPTRTHLPENFEEKVPTRYAFIYATDTCEGLIMINAATLLDGDPNNNFLKKDFVFNPNGILDGARKVSIFGNYAWVSCDAGIVIVKLGEPNHADVSRAGLGEFFSSIKIVKIIPDGEWLHQPGAVEMQFRYAFVCDHHGIKVFDVTDMEDPQPVSHLEIHEPHNIYLARTYAYVSGGHDGLIVVDITNPKDLKIDQVYTADGKINDLHDVKLGMTYVSEFAYLADGHNGLHVVQLTSPKTPGNDGFAPRPTPKLIASFHIPHGGHAYAISKGVDRDRAVDEAGSQLAVFGRVGARPMNKVEQEELYRHSNGKVWKVRDPKRNWKVNDDREREKQLHLQIEKFYGDSRLRLRLKKK
jgi:hypothetical protein